MSREIVNREYGGAVYYFPQWHPDPQNEERRGKGGLRAHVERGKTQI